MSSMLNIIAMHQAEELREQLAEQHRRRAHIMDVCQNILAILGDAKYSEWIETTPDDNEGFNRAAEAKLSELKS